MIGLKLDTGDGRNGGRSSFDVLPVDNKGEARDEYTKVGGAAKVRLFDTIVKRVMSSHRHRWLHPATSPAA
jgi:imipenem/basic amino acid-specific outer membrane pore